MNRFHLYRHFDADGSLLYVGQSANAFKRWGQHKGTSEWAAAAVTMRVEQFDSREAALAAERQAILLEKPRFNRYGIEKPKREHKKRSPKAGMPILSRLQDAELAAIDVWRREQPDMPSRPQALQRLAILTLDALEAEAEAAKEKEASDERL